MLEPQECTESRNVVREFYSYHFGNDRKLNAESLAAQAKFLSPTLQQSLQGRETDSDVFTTNSRDMPKSFRTGKCTVVEPNRTSFQVLLLWKDDTRQEQREINVEAVKSDGKWLVDKILN